MYCFLTDKVGFISFFFLTLAYKIFLSLSRQTCKVSCLLNNGVISNRQMGSLWFNKIFGLFMTLFSKKLWDKTINDLVLSANKYVEYYWLQLFLIDHKKSVNIFMKNNIKNDNREIMTQVISCWDCWSVDIVNYHWCFDVGSSRYHFWRKNHTCRLYHIQQYFVVNATQIVAPTDSCSVVFILHSIKLFNKNRSHFYW